MNYTEPLYEFANGESSWETMRKDAVWKKAFDDAMTTRTKFYSAPWHDKFPARSRIDEFKAKTSTKPVIVDLGGNQGVDLQSFATTNVDLVCELVLQDLPETIKNAPSGLDPRVKPTIHDFFTPQPIQGIDTSSARCCRELVTDPWQGLRYTISNPSYTTGTM